MTKTSIEWTRSDDGFAGESWNPTVGCTKVSPGCDSCYAIRQANMRAANPHPKVADAYANTVTYGENGLDWTGAVNRLHDRLEEPLRWRKPRRVFVNSMSDLFHDAVPSAFIAAVFDVMRQTPQHTYMILTKRHARMRSLMRTAVPGEGWPLPNVWLGVSVEDQKRADLRVPALLDTPAAVRFLSCEPLLGPVQLHRYLVSRTVHWIIAGGESGPKARPPHLSWFRSLRDECECAGVPFFFKQHGEWAPWVGHPEGESGPGDVFVNPDGKTGRVWYCGDLGYPTNHAGPWGVGSQIVTRVGKKRSGRELDGRTWDEFPTVTP